MKRGLEDVFSNEREYRKLFPQKSGMGRRFERIYLAYRLHRLLDRYGYANATTARRQRHGFWNTFWLLHLVIGSISRLYSRVTVKGIREAFDELEGRSRIAVRARRAMRHLTKATWAAWRGGKSRDPERWTPNNFFKATYGNKVLLRRALPVARKALRPIREHLLDVGG